MAGRTEFFEATSIIDNSKHHIAYTEWGDSANPHVLVCVHGLTRTRHDFDFLAQALEKDYRIICPDVPGRGQSDWLKNSADYTNPFYMSDLLGLLTYLAIPKCDWVGTSMGGIIGMMIAAFMPERIGKLVLNDVGAFIPKASLARIIEYAKKPREFSSRAEAEAYLREVYVPFGIREEAHWQHLFAHTLVERDGKIRLHYDPALIEPFRTETKNFTDIKDVDLWKLWEAVTCPTLLLRGAISDLFLKDVADKMRAMKPGTALVEFPGIGHAPTLMEPKQIEVVSNWLKN